jgi:hypothetical protein
MKTDPSGPRDGARDLDLGLGWSVDIERRPLGVGLTLRHPHRAPVEIAIHITADGPIVRAAAAALEVSAKSVVAKCERFAVEATEEVHLAGRAITQQAIEKLRCEGAEVEVVASSGDMRLRANDDVQVLGEQILLNCDREPPMPTWVARPPSGTATLPRQDSAGDLSLLLEPPRLDGA